MSRARWLIFAVAATLGSVFFINFCAAIFSCGCVSLWTGADLHCNVHEAMSRHCPWCAHGLAASVIPWALIVAVQGVVSFWKRQLHTAVRFGLAVAAFPIAGGILALAYGVSTGYWK